MFSPSRDNCRREPLCQGLRGRTRRRSGGSCFYKFHFLQLTCDLVTIIDYFLDARQRHVAIEKIMEGRWVDAILQNCWHLTHVKEKNLLLKKGCDLLLGSFLFGIEMGGRVVGSLKKITLYPYHCCQNLRYCVCLTDLCNEGWEQAGSTTEPQTTEQGPSW